MSALELHDSHVTAWRAHKAGLVPADPADFHVDLCSLYRSFVLAPAERPELAGELVADLINFWEPEFRGVNEAPGAGCVELFWRFRDLDDPGRLCARSCEVASPDEVPDDAYVWLHDGEQWQLWRREAGHA